jgi:NADH:ubiquinone oxidoreductase subunit 6 (subunit J)
MVIVGTRWPERATGAPEATVAEIGTGLMTTFVFPFEYASLVLLAAMVGAAILIRERAPQDDDDAGTEVQP